MNFILGMSTDSLVVLLDKFGVNVPLLAIQTINFLLVVYLLYRFAFRDVLKVMDKRNKQIQDGLKYSEDMKKELDNIETKRQDIISGAHSEANNIIHIAQKSATDLLEKQKAESQELAKNIISKAHADINHERETMFSELKGELKDMVVEAAEKILSRELSDKEKDSYKQQAIDILVKTV